jgi:hypothetical protein
VLSQLEYVSIVPEETGEREFLFLLKVITDDHRLGWVGKAEIDLLRRWRGVESGLGALLLRDGQVGLVDLLRFSHHEAEAPKQECVVAISKATVSHLNEISRSL